MLPTTSSPPAAASYSLIVDKAEQFMDRIPGLINTHKIGSKDLPTEVLKLAFFRQKQLALTGSQANHARAAKISPAKVWNTHARITKGTDIAHLKDWATCLKPPPAIKTALLSEHVPASTRSTLSPTSPTSPTSAAPANTPDELAIRGIVHRTLSDHAGTHAFPADAAARHATVRVSTWVSGVAWFEHAMLDLKEMKARAAGSNADVDPGAVGLVPQGPLEKLDSALETQQVALAFSRRVRTSAS